MSDPLPEPDYEAMHDRSLREHFAAAALTGLLSGVNIMEVLQSGKKLPSVDIANAAVILADRTIYALNAIFRPPTATEPGPETRKPVSPSANISADVPPNGGSVTPAPASSPTASDPQPGPAGKGENPQSWKRKAAPLSEG